MNQMILKNNTKLELVFLGLCSLLESRTIYNVAKSQANCS